MTTLLSSPFAANALRPSSEGRLTRGGKPKGSTQRGAVFVEYTIILVLVAVVSIPMIILLGVALGGYFNAQQVVITLPFP